MYEPTREQEAAAEALALSHDRVRVVRAEAVLYAVAERQAAPELWLRERAWIVTENGDLVEATVPYDLYQERLAEAEAWDRCVREATEIHEAEQRGEIRCRHHPDVPATSHRSGLCEECEDRNREAREDLRLERMEHGDD